MNKLPPSLILLFAGMFLCIAAPPSAAKTPPPLTISKAPEGKTAMISFTFDDGSADHYTVGAPVLEKYGLKGAFMIVVKRIGSEPKYMTWDQVRELDKRGHAIGNHTMTHQAIGLLYWAGTKGIKDKKTKELLPPDPEKLKAFNHEVFDAQAEFEKELGKRPTILCYPYNNEVDCPPVRQEFKNPVLAMRTSLDRSTTMETLDAKIQAQMKRNGNIVFITHGIDPQVKAYAPFKAKEEFETFVQKILEYKDQIHFGRYDENSDYAQRARLSHLKKGKDGRWTVMFQEKNNRAELKGTLAILLRPDLKYTRILVNGKETAVKTGADSAAYFEAANGDVIEVVE